MRRVGVLYIFTNVNYILFGNSNIYLYLFNALNVENSFLELFKSIYICSILVDLIKINKYFPSENFIKKNNKYLLVFHIHENISFEQLINVKVGYGSFFFHAFEIIYLFAFASELIFIRCGCSRKKK